MKWPSWLKGKLRATPGHAVTGIDQAAVIRRTAQSIWDRAEAGRKRLQEQDALWKYETRESFTAIVRRVGENKASVRPRYRAETVTEVGGNGHGMVWAEAWSIDDLDSELRFALAQHFIAHGLNRDFDEARERAALCTIHLELSHALGSKGGTL
jgi:hypothetical protein